MSTSGGRQNSSSFKSSVWISSVLNGESVSSVFLLLLLHLQRSDVAEEQVGEGGEL